MNKYIVCVFRDSIGFGCMIKQYIVTSEYNLTEENTKQEKKIERLQEQLKEANEVLSCLITPQTPSLDIVINYLEKWGVK